MSNLRAISEQELEDVKWLFNQCAPFSAHMVTTFVPPIFERYARIFHPPLLASKVSGDEYHLFGSWEYVAGRSGRTAHAQMQWHCIFNPERVTGLIDPPLEGSIPYEVSLPLRQILSSSTNERCYLAIWSGFAWDYRAYVPQSLSVEPEVGTGRAYDVFSGPTTMLDIPFHVGETQTANFIWASDRSWWLAIDIDRITTYIGGSNQLIESVLACDDLEIWPANPEDALI